MSDKLSAPALPAKSASEPASTPVSAPVSAPGSPAPEDTSKSSPARPASRQQIKSPSVDPPSAPSRQRTVSPPQGRDVAYGLVERGPIQAADFDDSDSAVGSLDAPTSTGSLASSIFEYRVLHGRTYNHRLTEYWAPNDDRQNDGLELLHNALTMMLNDQLYLAPIGDDPQNVLDLGTGTGCWAIDFADTHPGSQVIGTDLSPIQPTWVPPNVSFQIDDCLQDWTWPENHFDFVHMRALYGSIPDWDALYAKAFRHIKPGGWLEDLEMDVWPQSDHVPIGPDHIFRRWGELYYEVGERSGRTFAICTEHLMKEAMERAGFVDVTEVKIKVPLGVWPRDKHLKQVGELCLAAVDESLEGYGMYLFTTLLGWSAEEVIVYTARVRAEMKKRSNCPWVLTTVVYGRKP